MDQALKTPTTTGWALIREVTKEIIKLIVEHGMSRVLVAGGLLIPIYFFLRIPSEDWRVNVVIISACVIMVIVGGLIRIFEIKHHLFSGRSVLLRCSNPECRLPITGAFKLEDSPPLLVKCNHCKAINIIQ